MVDGTKRNEYFGRSSKFFFGFCPKKIFLDTQQNAEAFKGKKERTQPTLAGSSSSDGQCLKRAFFAPFFPKVIQTAFH